MSGAAPVARTAAGDVVGRRSGSVTVFHDVPYARAPVGSLRFASPRPPEPWAGVRDATRSGPVFLQDDGVPGLEDVPRAEDALTLTVWTPGTTGGRPVLLYLHGGAWELGAARLPALDGARLAAHGDLVVITVNYRLGGLGWGRHEALADPETGQCANWGLQDQAAAVRWVHENAPAFGGDPDAITLAGSSAGGSSTWQLAGTPETGALVARILPISACPVWEPATAQSPEDSRATYEDVARELGVTVPGLRDVPAERFRAAWQRRFADPPEARARRTGREYRGPVVDGCWITGPDQTRPVPPQPALIVHTRTEGSFYTGPESPQPRSAPVTEADLDVAVRDVLLKGTAEVRAAEVRSCVTAYRAAARGEGRAQDPVALWTEIWGDALFRHGVRRLAERHAGESSSATYLLEFAQPALPPFFGTPHELVAPFLFGTFERPELARRCGTGPEQHQVAGVLMDTVTSFARTGAPGGPCGLDPWPQVAPGAPTTVVLGADAVPRPGPGWKLDQLGYWDHCGWSPAVETDANAAGRP